VILIAGLQGSGKTTFSGKLANLLKSKGRNPLLVAADIYRPAAIDQLIALGKQIDIPVYSDRASGVGAVKIALDAIDHARKNVRDTVIIDTAGRLHVDEEMMAEVAGESVPRQVGFRRDCADEAGRRLTRRRGAFDSRRGAETGQVYRYRRKVGRAGAVSS
jgi:signal recognition particle GTPase